MLGFSGTFVFYQLQISIATTLLSGTWVIQNWSIGDVRQSLIQNAAVGTRVNFDGKNAIFGPDDANKCKYLVMPNAEIAIDLIGDRQGERVKGIVVSELAGIRLIFPIVNDADRPTKERYRLRPKLFWSIYLTKRPSKKQEKQEKNKIKGSG